MFPIYFHCTPLLENSQPAKHTLLQPPDTFTHHTRSPLQQVSTSTKHSGLSPHPLDSTSHFSSSQSFPSHILGGSFYDQHYTVHLLGYPLCSPSGLTCNLRAFFPSSPPKYKPPLPYPCPYVWEMVVESPLSPPGLLRWPTLDGHPHPERVI